MSVAWTSKSIATPTTNSSAVAFLAKEGIPPLGANNPACRPSADYNFSYFVVCSCWQQLALLGDAISHSILLKLAMAVTVA